MAAHNTKKTARSLRLRSIEGRPLVGAWSITASPSSSSAAPPCPPPLNASGTARLKSSPPTPAATTTSGKGIESTYSATNARTAKTTRREWLRVRLPILSTASTTIAITTGCTP